MKTYTLTEAEVASAPGGSTVELPGKRLRMVMVA